MPAGTLYVVATPIGNLMDVTLRALETLGRVDLIAAEDTQHTGILLKRHDISKRMIRYHEHNEESRARDLIGFLEAGDRERGGESGFAQYLGYVVQAMRRGVSRPGQAERRYEWRRASGCAGIG